MVNEHKDVLLWFDRLDAPKRLEANEMTAVCVIGFNRNVDGSVVGDEIETTAPSVAEALEDAKVQYEFLTGDVFSCS